MIVYKIMIHRHGGIYSPCVMANLKDLFQYKIRRTQTRPPGYGPMAAFKSIEDAENSLLCGTLMKCEAAESGRRALFTPQTKMVWTSVQGGTVFCDTITPLERIKRVP